MNIVMIGSGNVATVLGRKFFHAGHSITQVYSRNVLDASNLASEWNAVYTDDKTKINRGADVYLVAVPDDTIAEVVRGLELLDSVVAHTAASVSKEVLKGVTKHYGVFYPMQSLRREVPLLPEIPVYIDGIDDMTLQTLEHLARSIAGEKVGRAGDEERLKIHVAAVAVSNFTNHLYALVQDYCQKEGLNFDQLLPLIEETARRIRQVPPRLAQTGPAARHDAETIRKHVELLRDHPQLKNIYIVMTESIQQVEKI